MKSRYRVEPLVDGVELALAELPGSECAAVSIYLPAGGRDGVDLPAGVAHFVEHMVFKGTGRRSAREISLEVESLGGQLNAATTEEYTVYEGRGDAELLPVLCDVLADLVWNPTFPAGELELEREVIAEEIAMYRESPAEHIADLASEALWGEDALGRSITGTEASIREIGREELRAFHEKFYLAKGVVIAVAGPFSLEEVRGILLPLVPKVFREREERAVCVRCEPQVRCDWRRDTEQLQLSLAWHAPERAHRLRHAMRLLSLMLGESASSRLFLSLREERGLCYQVSSDVSFFRDTGAFEITLGLDPEAREEALRCIFVELEDLVKGGAREEELARAKRLSLSGSKAALEATAAHAMWAGESLLDFGVIPTPQAWREEMNAVSLEEIGEAARLLFEGKGYALAEIGPKPKKISKGRV